MHQELSKSQETAIDKAIAKDVINCDRANCLSISAYLCGVEWYFLHLFVTDQKAACLAWQTARTGFGSGGMGFRKGVAAPWEKSFSYDNYDGFRGGAGQRPPPKAKAVVEYVVLLGEALGKIELAADVVELIRKSEGGLDELRGKAAQLLISLNDKSLELSTYEVRNIDARCRTYFPFVFDIEHR
jgi:hypothetical protein